MAICPICKITASEIQKDFFFGKTYRCPRHKEFDVMAQVLESSTHMKASSNEWEAALERASEKATNRSRPLIRLFDFYDWKPQQTPSVVNAPGLASPNSPPGLGTS